MKYYFAYGSNLDQNQMTKRCPESKLIDVAFLEDYRLDFTIYSEDRNSGCADIVKEKGKRVWGLVYSVSKNDLEKLDKYEGCPTNYHRIDIIVSYNSGKSVYAYAYEVTNKQSFIKPSSEYLGIIKTAAEKFNFPKDYRKLLNKIT